MTDDRGGERPASKPQKNEPPSKEARLAEALRKNLRRRKDAQKAGKKD